MNNGVNYTIISRPSYITFECPFCHEEVEVNFEEVDFNTDYWGDGAWCDCPECGEEVELDDYEYDQENNIMKAYLVEQPAIDWCQDYAMVIIAEDERHAERKARVSSDDFKKCQEITITEIDMNEEQCVLTANTGAQENNYMADRQTKTIQWTINLPMDFPSDWDDDMIEFHLNESSWCCSNLISELEKYDEKNGCICGICEAKVAEKIVE